MAAITVTISGTKRVVVVGQGYVGLPLAMAAVTAGYDVVGFDLAVDRTKNLADGTSFTADVPDTELQAALDTGRYTATAQPEECADFDVAVITVPTPLREGDPDLTFIAAAARTLSGFLRPGALVVLESTTYPGTTEELMVPLLEVGSGLTAGADFSVGYSPERIDPGNQAWKFANTPKIVSGIDDASLAKVAEFYSSIVETVVPVAAPKVAELSKLLENTFRHVNIALVNELAVFAAELDIDIWAAIDAAATKPFGYMKFTPGPGVGGHCLPIDPSYLSWTVRRRVGRPFRFVELANDVNEHMPHYVVERVRAALNKQGIAPSRSRLLLLGMSYKRNTNDTRESPARTVAKLLVADGADVHAVDQYATIDAFGGGVSRADLTVDEVRAADLVIVLTDHDDVDYEMVVAEATAVLDTRHRVEGSNVEHL
ncbi:MAG TPA: nucleotide sugar dehydrogenase [Ilumatobacteraceae bacterium]|jgi:UDP-N-acetyl-D-glucosamine dehydrogenase|nr:nucleotide sugar dehydrogenase [Ilumatobacteraceae bacterium]